MAVAAVATMPKNCGNDQKMCVRLLVYVDVFSHFLYFCDNRIGMHTRTHMRAHTAYVRWMCVHRMRAV